MKRDRFCWNSARRRSQGSIRSLARSIAATTVLLLSVGCTLNDALSEYTGVDLIGDRGGSVDSLVPAHVDGSDPVVPFEYLGLTALGASEYGSTSGLPAEAVPTIRRLEARNLVPDGDFEQSTAGSAPLNWDIDSTTAPPQIDPGDFTVAASGVIQGNSVHFETGGDSAAVLDLDAHALDGFVEPGTYFLSLQFVRDFPVSEMTFGYGDGAGATYLYNQPWVIPARRDGLTPLETLPTPGDPLLDNVTVFSAIGVDPASDFLYVGSPIGASGQQGHLDNVRLGRLDPLPHLAVPIALQNGDGSLPLLAGTYRVSVWVKSEIDDQVTPAANGRNRFRAGQIVLGINDRFELFRRSDVEWSASEWKQLSAEFQIDAAELSDASPLRAQLTVIHPERPRIGSVLIAGLRVQLVTAFTTD